jgi:hypothetical protein
VGPRAGLDYLEKIKFFTLPGHYELFDVGYTMILGPFEAKRKVKFISEINLNAETIGSLFLTSRVCRTE